MASKYILDYAKYAALARILYENSWKLCWREYKGIKTGRKCYLC